MNMLEQQVISASWRTSTYSGASEGGDCIQVALGARLVGVRDSKQSRGPVLVFDADRWRTFVTTMSPC